MEKIKILFSSSYDNIYVLKNETEYTFVCFYYDNFENKVTDREVTFNKSRLLGWEFLK